MNGEKWTAVKRTETTAIAVKAAGAAIGIFLINLLASPHNFGPVASSPPALPRLYQISQIGTAPLLTPFQQSFALAQLRRINITQQRQRW